MRWTMAVGMALALLVVQSRSYAQDRGFGCGTEGSDTTFIDATIPPSTARVSARLIFIAFPNSPTCVLPSWADDMAATLEAYFTTMSRGAQQLDVSVLRRPTAPDSAWVVANPSSCYADLSEGWLVCNEQVMTAIAEAMDSVWVGVDMVFAVHYQCTFPCPGASDDTTCQMECLFGGKADLVPPGHAVPYFVGNGVTSRIYGWLDLNGAWAAAAGPLIAAHEYGHLLGLGHDDGWRWPYGNRGHYSIMRSAFPRSYEEDGIVPIGTQALMQPYIPEGADGGLGWLPKVVITNDTLGLRIPDLRSDGGFAVEVPVLLGPYRTLYPPWRRGWQSYVLVNHQGANPYDARYDGTGLLIWHRAAVNGAFTNVFDLESAAGKFTSGAPNPQSGKDPLEADSLFAGSGADFWGGANANFDRLSNPSTAAYLSVAASATQDSTTAVAFENIHVDAVTGDMIVDVFLTPKQYLTGPAPGDTVIEGVPAQVTWAVRSRAGIDSVRIVTVSEGDTTLVAGGLPNTGSYWWTPGDISGSCKLQLISCGPAGAGGRDSRTLTVRPAGVDDVSAQVGKYTAVIRFTAPGEGEEPVAAYDLRYATAPITLGNFGSAMPASTGDPNTPGAVECVEIDELQACTQYHFALRYRANDGLWSGLSNVYAASTSCGLELAVMCDGDGFVAQGEGKDGWSIEGLLLDEQHVGDLGSLDQRQLVAWRPREGEADLRLTARGTRMNLDFVELLSTEHPIELAAFAVAGGALLGRTEPAMMVDDGRGVNLASVLAKGEVDLQVGRGGQLLVDLADTRPAPWLLIECGGGDERSADADSGIVLLRQSAGKEWVACASVAPRAWLTPFLVDSVPGGQLKLTFGREYRLRRLLSFVPFEVRTLSALKLTRAVHSRFGPVVDALEEVGGSATVLRRGESVTLGYAAPELARGTTRDYFLVARGTPASREDLASSQAAETEAAAESPEAFALYPSQPNPSTQAARIRFDLPRDTHVRLEVFDLQGRQVARLADGTFPAGRHCAEWDGRGASRTKVQPGVYVYRLEAGAFRSQRKLVFVH